MNDAGADDRRPLPARRRPRLLRIITRLSVSGPSTHVTLANQGLNARGWETLLVHGRVEPDEQEYELAVPDLAMRRIESLARPVDPIADARTALSLLKVVRAFRPDIIHTHHSKAGLIGRSAAILAGVPRVHTFHGNVFEGYFGRTTSAAVVTAERLLGARTSRLIALSPSQRLELINRRIGSPDRIEIVPLGLDLDRFRGIDRNAARHRLGLSLDATVIVAVGRIVPIKRVDRLIRAYALVHARRPDASLYIIGDGQDRPDAERQAIEAGLADTIHFIGWRSDTTDWYAAADFVALTSDNEGTPLALIEGAAAGRPVVATAVGGVPDVVQDGITGLLAPADDEPALAEAMIRMSEDADLRARLGAAAPHAADGYGKDRLVDDLERIYRSLLRPRAATDPSSASASDAAPISPGDEPRHAETLGEVDRDPDRERGEPQ